MSDLLPVWCELICDECSRQLAGVWSNGLHIPRVLLKDKAEMEGAVLKGNEIFCKACAATGSAAQQAEQGREGK